MNFEESVFINCPFDEAHINDLLKPVLYVIVKNGLQPRISLEISDSGQSRLDKIIALIRSCRYSIHDISLARANKGKEYARMNMPFELGIDFGLRNSGVAPLHEKQFLIMEATR